MITAIKQEFGDDIYHNNLIQSSKLAALVFADPLILNKLNSIVHPFVKKDFNIWCENQDSKLVFKEAAILFESNSNIGLDAVICVCANEQFQDFKD